ncbi:MAG: hypothetical protein AAFY46_07155, partial [Planctomycetota bacterium]
TCPWHGYQYRTGDGCSPPPYTERLATYDVRIRAGRVEVKTTANDLGAQTQAGSMNGDEDGNG